MVPGAGICAFPGSTRRAIHCLHRDPARPILDSPATGDEVVVRSIGPCLLLVGSLLGLACQDHPTAVSDRTAPASIDDLAATWCIDTTVKLRWTAPGDDANSGMASNYEIRYAISPLASEEALQTALTVNFPVTRSAGTPDSIALGGLTLGGNYAFRIRAADEAGNWGAWSNVASAPSSNQLPEPALSFLADSLAVGDTLVADASGTYDAESPAAIDFRWDWNGDGAWDIDWSRSPIARHTTDTPGRHTVRLQVRDAAGGRALAESSYVAAAFACLEQLSTVWVEVQGDCCFKNANDRCLSCWTRLVAADSTTSPATVERDITYTSGSAISRRQLQMDLEQVRVVSELTTVSVDAAASASSSGRLKLQLSAPLAYSLIVQCERRAGTGTAPWHLEITGLDGVMHATVGGDGLSGPEVVSQSGSLDTGTYWLETQIEATGACDARITFELHFTAVPHAQEAQP
jgi:hypothetical protein